MSETSYCQGCLRQEEIAALEAEKRQAMQGGGAAKNSWLLRPVYCVQEHSFRRDEDRWARPNANW